MTICFPWLVAFAFWLLHGLGFGTGLGAVGLPRDQLLTALLSFNLGVEIGQIAFVGAVLLALATVRSLGLEWLRPVRLAPAYLVGILGRSGSAKGPRPLWDSAHERQPGDHANRPERAS